MTATDKSPSRPRPPSSRAKLFREADLARAVRVLKLAGIEIAAVKIDASGGIMIESRSPSQGGEDGPDAVQAALDALDKRNAARRAARLVSGQNETRRR